jgi:formate dehydrogenase accessory protein FdhD
VSAHRAAAAPGARHRSTGRPAAQPASTRTASRFGLGHEPLTQVETVASECPVALVYNGVSHAVMMASPTDLEDMGRGFTLTEGIVAEPAEIASVEVLDMVLGFEIRVEIPPDRAAALDERRRSMVGGSACGLCGVISLDRAIRPLPRARLGPQASAEAIRAALAAVPGLQHVHRQTGAVHAAAMASPDGEILLLREDVGRHNALDKLAGAAAAAGLDPAWSLLLLTSRCSAEMIQKAATAGFITVATISAPTSLAISLAEEADLTLIAFARGDKFTAYTRPDRISP